MTARSESIGVAIPTYQRPELLQLLLETIPPDVTVAVSDNGSHLSAQFQASHAGVTFDCTKTVLPMFSNWNNAARLQSADWMSLTSDDDLYLPGAFEEVRRAVDAHPDADMIIFGHHLIDGTGRRFDSWQPAAACYRPPSGFTLFRYGVSARMPSVFFRRTLYDKLGGFMQELKLTAADSDFIQRAALVGTVQCIPTIISGYRVWEGGLTASRIATTEWLEEIDKWCTNVADFAKRHGHGAATVGVRDEIYLRNLLAGVMALRRHEGRLAGIRHLVRHGVPRGALPASYLRLLAAVLRPLRRIARSPTSSSRA